MTPNEQVQLWVGGTSVHNAERDECCPDFSCCRPKLLASEEERQKFYKAHHAGDSKTTNNMLAVFLGKLISSDDVPEGEVVVTDGWSKHRRD